jgi:hypothetical protein
MERAKLVKKQPLRALLVLLGLSLLLLRRLVVALVRINSMRMLIRYANNAIIVALHALMLVLVIVVLKDFTKIALWAIYVNNVIIIVKHVIMVLLEINA